MSRKRPRNRIGKSYEISSLGPDSTGLSYTLLARIDSERLRGGDPKRYLQFPPRVEVYVGNGKRFALSLLEPLDVVTNKKISNRIQEDELTRIRDYLRLNQRVLIDYFYANVPDSEELIENLQKLD